MPAIRDSQNRWRYRKLVTLADGTKTRITGTPAINTKAAAEHAERVHIDRVLHDGPRIGRPLAADEPRTINLTIRLTTREAERIERLAKAAGVSIADYARDRLLPEER